MSTEAHQSRSAFAELADTRAAFVNSTLGALYGKLIAAVRRGELVLITGEAGLGKTMTLRKLDQYLRPDFHPTLIQASASETAEDFLAAAAAALKPAPAPAPLLARKGQRRAEPSDAAGPAHPVLLVDDAEALADETLLELV